MSRPAHYFLMLLATAACLGVSAPQLLGDEGKSGRGPFFKSLVIPGWGQREVGLPRRGGLFIGSEVLLWGTVLGLRTYGEWRRTDYEGYATVHAGVDGEGHTDRYYADIGDFPNVEAHNDETLRNRRPRQLYGAEMAWEWDSESSRKRYRSLRLSSKRAYQRATFAVGAVVLNHLVSAIDAAFQGRRGRLHRQADSVNLSFAPANSSGGLVLWLSYGL